MAELALRASPPEVVDNLNRQIGAVANSTSKAANRAGSQLILSELAANWLEWAARRYQSLQTAKNLRSDILPLLQMFGSEIVERWVRGGWRTTRHAWRPRAGAVRAY